MDAATLQNLVERHDNDLYRGDDRKPGLTLRVESIEVSHQRICTYLSRIVWLLVTLLVGTIYELLTKHQLPGV